MPLSSSKSKVCFFFQDVEINLRNRTDLKEFILTILRKEGKKPGSINYIFCSDKALLAINRKFLKHDYYTDIITFDLSGTGSTTAEIYISVDRVRENAKNLGVNLKSELHRVIFHGILHLCGYMDKTSSETKKMRNREEMYLAMYLKVPRETSAFKK